MSLLVTMGLGTSPPAFKINTLASTTTTIVLTFNEDFAISGPAMDPTEYTLTDSLGGSVAIIGVERTDVAELTVATGDQAAEATYVLQLPHSGFLSVASHQFQGSFSQQYISGAGITATVILVRVVNGKTLDVYFDINVNEMDASTTSKYSIRGLEVLSAVKVVDSQYRLTTSIQTPGAEYSLVISNIRGL